MGSGTARSCFQKARLNAEIAKNAEHARYEMVGDAAAVVRELVEAGLAGGATFETFIEDFGKANSHRDGYVAALVHGAEVAGNARPYALSIRGLTKTYEEIVRGPLSELATPSAPCSMARRTSARMRSTAPGIA